jgi:hypothetical protein
MNASALRQKFLALAGNLKRATVTVPELGTVTVRELDGHARASIETAMLKKENDGLWKLTLIARSVIDPDTGLVVFDDADLDALGKLPARVLDPLFVAAFKLSGMGEAGVEDAQGN